MAHIPRDGVVFLDFRRGFDEIGAILFGGKQGIGAVLRDPRMILTSPSVRSKTHLRPGRKGIHKPESHPW